MDAAAFFTVRRPSVWGSIPTTFSHSSLSRIRRCALRFQLERSEFPGVGRFPVRPNPAAVEGTIVHSCLERLLKAFSAAGFPALGSDAARDCARCVDLSALIRHQIDDALTEFAAHPRGAAFRPRSSTAQLGNRVIRLFRHQYASMDRPDWTGIPKQSAMSGAEDWSSEAFLRSGVALTEKKLKHPVLRFEGVIDLVCRRSGKTVIVDYKAGGEDPTHLLQARRYALLWWRATGDLPSRFEVHYLDGGRTEELSKAALERCESELEQEITTAAAAFASTPATASPGTHCQHCDVRQFCDAYWRDSNVAHRTHGAFADIQVSVASDPTEYGFAASMPSGSAIKITSAADVGKFHYNGLNKGQRLRVTGALTTTQRDDFHISKAAEIWRMAEDLNF